MADGLPACHGAYATAETAVCPDRPGGLSSISAGKPGKAAALPINFIMSSLAAQSNGLITPTCYGGTDCKLSGIARFGENVADMGMRLPSGYMGRFLLAG